MACKIIISFFSSLINNSYLDQDECIKFGNTLDTVLHLIISDLDQTTVALLLQHGVQTMTSHPGVSLDIFQLDPLSWILHQHLPQQIQKLRREISVRR